MPTALILGGGFGGVSAAVRLRERAPAWDVVLVDAKERFRMGLAALRALDGRDAGDGRPLLGLARLGVRVVRGRVEAIDVAARRVRTDTAELAYDKLVVALGADLAPERVPGLPPEARNVYAVEGAAGLHADLQRLRGGRVLLVAPAMPWKCPPAPYEAACIAKGELRRRGVEAEVVLATPEPHPLPVFPPEVGASLRATVEARGVVVRNGLTLQGFDGRTAVFGDGTRLAFDALGLVPPHVPPPVVAPLAGPSGWIEVDASTLRTRHEDVYAVGDCTVLKLASGKPLPKAGVLAEGEGVVVADRIAGADARFDGRGTCFIELGDGTAIEGNGEFFAAPTPVMRAGAPTRDALAAKVAWERARLDAWFGPST